jgi:hypothetical protein
MSGVIDFICIEHPITIDIECLMNGITSSATSIPLSTLAVLGNGL